MEPIPESNHRQDAEPPCFWIIVVCMGLFPNTGTDKKK
jgi:hypothetical protein